VRLPRRLARRKAAAILQQRAADARSRAAEAEAEAALSRARVIRPLAGAGTRNQFADMLRATIVEGHGGGQR
jgi:hypothetical protein